MNKKKDVLLLYIANGRYVNGATTAEELSIAQPYVSILVRQLLAEGAIEKQSPYKANN